MANDEFTINEDGILTDESGSALATFVDSFVMLELVYPEASVILLRLYESGTVVPGQVVTARNANQVRMSAATARRLAKQLMSAADELDGVGAQKH